MARGCRSRQSVARTVSPARLGHANRRQIHPRVPVALLARRCAVRPVLVGLMRYYIQFRYFDYAPVPGTPAASVCATVRYSRGGSAIWSRFMPLGSGSKRLAKKKLKRHVLEILQRGGGPL